MRTQESGAARECKEQMLIEMAQGIVEALRGKALRIVLYGSVARGTQGEDSDIDIAVFVPDRLTLEEADRLSDAVVDMNLKYDRVFSVVDIEENVYQKWREVAPFYQGFDREGLVLWAAA